MARTRDQRGVRLVVAAKEPKEAGIGRGDVRDAAGGPPEAVGLGCGRARDIDPGMHEQETRLVRALVPLAVGGALERGLKQISYFGA